MESKRFCSFLKYSFYFRHPRLFLALGLGFSFLFITYRNQNHVTSLSSFDSNLLNIHYRNLESHVLGSKTFHTFFPLSDSYSPSLRKLAIFGGPSSKVNSSLTEGVNAWVSGRTYCETSTAMPLQRAGSCERLTQTW